MKTSFPQLKILGSFLCVAAVLHCSAWLITGCATGGQSCAVTRMKEPSAVLGKTWQWVSTITPAEKVTVRNPERYTIRLIDEGKIQARFDCNLGGGSYAISAGRLSFGPLLSTRMACSSDSLDATFLAYIQMVKSFFIECGDLYLELPHDSGTMRFRPAP